MQDKYSEAFAAIKGAKRVLVASHSRPDGDALASLGVISELLANLGKEFFVYSYDKPSFQFAFLPHLEKINSNKTELVFFNYDLIIVLDCGSISRTKLDQEMKNKKPEQKIIEFDHHPGLDSYADIEIRDSNAASTTEVLYKFLKSQKIKFNKNYATCILTGLITDTGNFLFPSTSDLSINIASEMLKYGAPLNVILHHYWRNKSLPAMKAWGKAMNNININKKYNLAYTILLADDLKGLAEEDVEGMAEFLSVLYGVKAILLLREEKNNLKGSLRTSDKDIDVSKLARFLGGGGHKKASGFDLEAKIKYSSGKWETT